MAFTQPRTWVAGEVPTAVLLNAQIRDNNNELALHAHTGGSGSGSSALGGTIGLTHIDFRDAAAPTGAGGTITRLYSSGSQVGRVEPGGTAAIFATSGHEHSITSVGLTRRDKQGSGAGVGEPAEYIETAGSASGSWFCAEGTSRAIGGSGQRVVVVTGGFAIATEYVGFAVPATARLRRDGTILGTRAYTLPSSTGGGSGTAVLFLLTAVDTSLASGSATWTVDLRVGDGSSVTYVYARAIEISEVKQS